MANSPKAQFVRYFGPLLDALRALGGSASPTEATDKVAEICGITKSQQDELTGAGVPRFYNQVAWARFYLKREGYLESSTRGIWRLTESGWKTHLTDEDAFRVFQSQAKKNAEERGRKTTGKGTDASKSPEEALFSESVNYRDRLLALIQALPFEGFERLCQRLLREAGFRQVEVLGRAGDQGIDGRGILQINEFVSFRVLFQCKRYKGSVGAPVIRDFRGAMQGRADKGIILTTGAFTVEARSEAQRDGAPPIELVDGENLLDLFEKFELGLRPFKTYELDRGFFKEFGLDEQGQAAEKAASTPSATKLDKQSKTVQ